MLTKFLLMKKCLRSENMAKNKFITKISNKRDSIVFTYDTNKFNINCVQELIKKYGSKIKFASGIKPMITLKLEKQGEAGILQEVKEFLK